MHSPLVFGISALAASASASVAPRISALLDELASAPVNTTNSSSAASTAHPPEHQSAFNIWKPWGKHTTTSVTVNTTATASESSLSTSLASSSASSTVVPAFNSTSASTSLSTSLSATPSTSSNFTLAYSSVSTTTTVPASSSPSSLSTSVASASNTKSSTGRKAHTSTSLVNSASVFRAIFTSVLSSASSSVSISVHTSVSRSVSASVSSSVSSSLVEAASSVTTTPRASAPAKKGNRFYLRTHVKSGQGNKQAFNGLYLFAYHTGAGLNDAMLTGKKSIGILAFAKPGHLVMLDEDVKPADYFNVLFKLGSLPYELIPTSGSTPYGGLQPVHINVGASPPTNLNAFYFEGDTLQWTNAAGLDSPGLFHGWMACRSSHPDISNPKQAGIQLFYRSGNVTPAECAEVDLVPVFVA